VGRRLDAARAVPGCERARSPGPSPPAARRPRARLYEMKGRHRDAAVMYERAAGHAAGDLDRVSLLRMGAAAAERGGAADDARRLGDAAAALAAEAGDGSGPGAAIPAVDSPPARLRALEERLRRARDPEAA